MLPNNSRSNKKRLKALTDAIKKIYSTFKGEAKNAFRKNIPQIQEEKMAILIQELVGQVHTIIRDTIQHLVVFYKSMNYYPVSYMKRNEGVAISP